MGKRAHTVIKRLPIHAKLSCHKGYKNSGAGCGHPPLYLNAVVAKRQAARESLLLQKLQAAQTAIVFLCNSGHGEDIVFQPLAGWGHVQHDECK